MAEIHQFNHAAMATHFQVRIAHDERTYAAQAAQAAFDLVDSLESCLSRFRNNSDIARAASLVPGEKMRLSEAALREPDRFGELLGTAPGVVETFVAAYEGCAYLKLDPARFDAAAFERVAGLAQPVDASRDERDNGGLVWCGDD